jgi:hypothetical protein
LGRGYRVFTAGEAEFFEGPAFEVMVKAASDAGGWLHAGSVSGEPQLPGDGMQWLALG